MTKPQKLKISIKLELPLPLKAEDIQRAHISIIPVPHNTSSHPPAPNHAPSFVNPIGESVCPFLVSGSGEGSCTRYTHYHQGPLPEGRGRASYHDGCTTNRCHYYGRCPKSKSRSRSKSPQPNIASGLASSESSYKGCPSPGSGDDQNSTKGFETPPDKQRGSDRGSS